MARKAKPRTKAAAPAAEPFFQPFARLGKKGKGGLAKPASPSPSAATTAGTTPSASRRAAAPPRPAPAPPAPRPDGQSRADDAETFAIYMAGVKELDRQRSRIPATADKLERPPRVPPPAIDPDAAARARMRSLVADGIRFDVSDDGRSLDGRRLDVDPREIRRLRRGAYAVDGTLDLHGMAAGEAREAVEAFVKKRRAEGDRMVMIIHGKGKHSPRGVGVLRGEIAAWLSQGAAAHHVAAFASTPDEVAGHDGVRGGAADGSPAGASGAVMVLLAR